MTATSERESSLTASNYFHIYKNMETANALDALSALAHESRLAVFRLLVQAGPEGMAAGLLAERLEIPPATMSFHLAHLARADLVATRREGRSIIYAADYGRMNGLVAYLTENCCRGGICAAAPARQRRTVS